MPRQSLEPRRWGPRGRIPSWSDRTCWAREAGQAAAAAYDGDRYLGIWKLTRWPNYSSKCWVVLLPLDYQGFFKTWKAAREHMDRDGEVREDAIWFSFWIRKGGTHVFGSFSVSPRPGNYVKHAWQWPTSSCDFGGSRVQFEWGRCMERYLAAFCIVMALDFVVKPSQIICLLSVFLAFVCFEKFWFI